VDAAWLLLLGLSLGGSVLWSGARRRLPTQTPELTIALTVAALDAARRGHARVEPAHLVAAALVARAHSAFAPASASRERGAGEAVDRALDALPAAPEPIEPHLVQLGPALLHAVQRAGQVAMVEMTALGLDEVLDELAADDAYSELVRDVRASPPPSSASAVSSHGGAPYRAPPPEELARCAVVLWNDDVSTMEGVLAVLRECFAKAEPEALHAMLTTHYVGHAVVGHYARDEAEARAAHATRRARELGMPLEITVALPDGALLDDKSTLTERVLRFLSRVAA
jgi:ATP-dependent Clp protease adapter protein ClpS